WGYGFLLTAKDGKRPHATGVDRFRIKIWNRSTDAVVYDNVMGAPEDIDSGAPQAIARGAITIVREDRHHRHATLRRLFRAAPRWAEPNVARTTRSLVRAH